VDLDVAPHLLEAILIASEAGRPGDRVVVDVRGVTFIDSSGLATLVDAHRRITAAEQLLVLGNVPERVHRVVTLTGLDQLMAVEMVAEEQDRAS
jgi:anti-anti-sigma factor